MELFLEACHWRGPLRLNVEYQGQSLTMERVLHQPFALVGCDPRMDLFLYHPQVSRRHAYLQLLGGKLFCIHLHSQRELRWQEDANGSKSLDAERAALHIGPFRIRATGGSEDLLSLANFSALEFSEEESPEVALEFVNRLPGPTVWRMTTMLALMGSAPLCRVRLVGNSVSKFHCSLVRTPLGLWVIDLFGKGGITVNETPVRSARLEDGDRLQVGNFIIRPRYLQPAPSRIPFSHLGEATGPIVDQAGSSISLPAFPETLSKPAASPTPETAPSSVPSMPGTSGVEAPFETPPLSLVPQLWPTPGESTAGNADVVQSLLVPITQQMGLMQQQMFEQFQQAMLMMFQMFGKLQREQIGAIRDEMDRLHQLSREVLALQAELAKREQPAPERARSTPAAAGPRGVPNHVATNPASRSAPAPNPAAESKPLPLPQGQPEKDMHAWLTQRLATLQQERQSRWQKIVNFLGGRRDTTTPDKKP
jgi:pSer/pThr/pTyr-binding forkhead associated (FHA) protein